MSKNNAAAVRGIIREFEALNQAYDRHMERVDTAISVLDEPLSDRQQWGADRCGGRAQKLHDLLAFLAGCQRWYGPSEALLRFGQDMGASCDIPDWMPRGKLGKCYAAAVLALVAAQGRGQTDLRYTEGYAIATTGLPLPIQHAWLSDGQCRVFDPTWPDHHQYVYFGIPFETSFVLDTLEEADFEPGLFVNAALMRKYLADPDRFAKAIAGEAEATAVRQPKKS